jgi:hypothetical protein
LLLNSRYINDNREINPAVVRSGTLGWTSAAGWQTLTTANAEAMVVGPGGEMYGDFGGSGLWRWSTSAG